MDDIERQIQAHAENYKKPHKVFKVDFNDTNIGKFKKPMFMMPEPIMAEPEKIRHTEAPKVNYIGDNKKRKPNKANESIF